MKGNPNRSYKEYKKSNLVIITKNFGNFYNKNISNRNLVTYQSGDLSYKLNINSSKISHEKILKTISTMKKQYESKKEEYLNSSKINRNDKTLIKEEINNEIMNEFDFQKNNKINKKELEPVEFKRKAGGNEIVIFNKTNSILDNEFESKNKKVSNCYNINKINEKSNNMQDKNSNNNTKIENKDNNTKIENKDNNDNEEIINNSGTVHEDFTSNTNVNNKDDVLVSNNISNTNTNQIKIYNNNYIIYNNNYYICNNCNNIEKNDNTTNRKLINEKFVDNISENKNLINNPNNNALFSKKIVFSSVNENKEIGINTFHHQQKKLNENYIDAKSKIIQDGHTKCFICDRDYLISRLFVAECGIHYLCRKCVKNFYEDKIENIAFIKDDNLLKCPCESCDKKINFNIIKNKISDRHLALCLQKIKNNMSTKMKSSILSNQNQNDENIKFYTQKHVIDINSNENFFLYNKSKDIFCKRCLKPTLFTKTNTNFIICLNCRFKMCKLCLKEYQDRHTEIKTKNHCRVYYKRNELFLKKNDMNILIIILLQYIFAFATFIIMIFGTFYNIIHFMKRLLFIDDKKPKNGRRNIGFCWYMKYILALIIGMIIYVIIFPFMFISFPFFPILMSVLDYQ